MLCVSTVTVFAFRWKYTHSAYCDIKKTINQSSCSWQTKNTRTKTRIYARTGRTHTRSLFHTLARVHMHKTRAVTFNVSTYACMAEIKNLLLKRLLCFLPPEVLELNTHTNIQMLWITFARLICLQKKRMSKMGGAERGEGSFFWAPRLPGGERSGTYLPSLLARCLCSSYLSPVPTHLPFFSFLPPVLFVAANFDFRFSRSPLNRTHLVVVTF